MVISIILMYRDSDGEIVTEWVELRPTLGWFMAKGHREFDGDILVKSWEGKIQKMFSYESGKLIRQMIAGKLLPLRSTSINKNMSLMNSGSGAPSPDPNPSGCITTNYWVTIPGTTCSCAPSHRYGEPCTCESTGGKGPTPSKNLKYAVVECWDEPPVVVPGGAEGEGGTAPGTGSVGGGTAPGDYPPLNCNPDPDYTVPTVPPPPGEEYILPCSAIPTPQVPIEPTEPTEPAEPTPLTAYELLMKVFSLHGFPALTVPMAFPLTDEQNSKLLDFIAQREDNADLYDLAYWGFIEVTGGNITWEKFENWFLGDNPFTPEYTKWVISEQKQLNLTDVSDYFDRRHIDYNLGGESNIIFKGGGYDENISPFIDLSQQNNWQTISPVIPSNQFVKYDGRNCLYLAKEQIEKIGYTISDYYAQDSYGEKQTINLFNGTVNSTEVTRGINYLHYALKKGVPVVVGVDYTSGHPGNLDNTTDHFIVIVGMGNDLDGNYFRYYDPATRITTEGTSIQNRLYFDSVTKKITGQGIITFAGGAKTTYTLTMIRKSKNK